MLELGAVFCGVFYTLSCRHITTEISSWVFTAGMALGGALFYIPLALLPINVTHVVLDITIPNWLPFASIIYLGVMVSIVGYGLYNFGVAKLSATEAGAYVNLIPVITLIIGVYFLEEKLTITQYIASILILIGMLLSQITFKKRKRK